MTARRALPRRAGAAARAAIVAVAALALVGVPAALSAAAPAASAVSASAPSAPASAKPRTPLTPRLALLADPAVAGMPGRDRARRLSLPPAGPGSLMTRPGGRVLIELRVTDTSPATLERLRRTGAVIVFVDAARAVVTAEVPPGRLRALAAVQPQVRSATEVLQPVTHAACPTGTVSEGDGQLKAAIARADHAVNGAGVTVGILSDSYNVRGGAPADVASADLPGAGNPCGFPAPVGVQREGSSGLDEGRAMAQIVHDLAPGATIRFATAFNGPASMAQEIRSLAAAGAKVIVDDVSYLNEPMYQDGVIGKAVEDVVAQGVSYFSSAGNSNVVLGGRNVGSYEAMAFRPTACPATVTVVYPAGSPITCHDFNPGAVADPTYGLGANGDIRYSLGWNEPELGVTTDLDLLLFSRTTGKLLAESASDSLAAQQATEFLGGTWSGALDLVVVRDGAGGVPRLKLNGWGSRLTAVDYSVSAGGDVVGPTINGHNASRSGVTVAAVPYNNAGAVESFSSRGPAAYCWAPVAGTTPAPPISPCQSATVDLAATDGTRNSFFGSNINGTWRFYGTSAAAPHAAAIAALIRARQPCLSPAQVTTALKNTAGRISGIAVDVQGAGLVDADLAVGALACSPPQPGRFTAQPPQRVLDTRSGLGAPKARLGAGGAVTVAIPGLPATATSVTLNVTAVGATASTYLTVFPAGHARPNASNLNVTAGQTIPNLVTVPVSAGKRVTIFNAAGSVDVLADLAGYYASGTGSGFSAHTPMRVLDTRYAVGAPKAKVGAGGSVTLTVPGLPAGTTAVTLNVTATNPTATTYLTAYPAGAARPGTSNLNVVAGQTIANLVTVAVGTDHRVTIYNHAGTVDVLADLAGHYAAGTGGAFTADSPRRVLDTRTGLGAPRQKLGPGGVATLPVPGLPASATGVILNVTAVAPTAASYLTVYPGGAARPNASNLNFVSGQTIPNLVNVGVGPNNTTSFYNNAGQVDVLADLAGWFDAG